MEMETIKFVANQQTLARIKGKPAYASNVIRYIQVEIQAQDPWTSFDSVELIFQSDRKKITKIPELSDGVFRCTVPQEMALKISKVFMNLVGKNVENGRLVEKLTTYPCLAFIVNAYAQEHGLNEITLTANQYDQFVENVKTKVKRIEDLTVSAHESAEPEVIKTSPGGGAYNLDFGLVKGDTGETGNGIANALMDEDYALTLHFTDGTSYTTPSIRGEKGEQGEQGESIKGDDGFSPTVDVEAITGGHTVTITDIDGEHEFNVMDGEDSNNVQSDWDETDSTSDAYILNKPAIPSKTSDLTNDSGYISAETDPTVPSWAKSSSKPTYTFAEINTKPDSIGGYGITDAYTKTEVDGLVSGVLHYKGTKATTAELPSTGNKVGDTWHITANGSEWAWDGTQWQELGTAVDLSGYVPTSRKVNGKALSSDIALTASDVSALPSDTAIPSKTSDLTNDSGYITGMEILSYGSSTWNDFITAYNAKKVVYCRASSNANPASGSQTRLAFMAYVNNATSPTSVEFQYYRSVSSHSASQQGDQVFVYTLTSAGTWSVTTREASSKVAAGTGLSSSYASGTITLNLDATIPTKTSDLTNDSGFLTDAVTTFNGQSGAVTYSAPVSSVNGQTGAVSLSIPSKTSDLTNDSGFVNASGASAAAPVQSVNGDTGTVVLDADDVGALPTTEKSVLFYGQVDSTSTATVFTAQIDGITEYFDGLTVMLKNGVVTSASGFTININGLGAKHAYSNMAAATAETTIFNVNYTMLFTYDSTRVEGGGWICYRGYNSDNNTIGYQLRTNSMSLPMKSATWRYRLLFTSADGEHFVPANNSNSTNATSSRTVCQDAIDPFGDIRYYGTTASVAANSRPSATALWSQYAIALGYSFNRTGAALTLTSWKPVYVKCAPQSDGSAIIDSTTPYVQDLPTTEDGKIYIELGVAYSATNIELVPHHPVYWYKNGKIRQYTNADVGVQSASVTQIQTSGTKIATVTIDGTATDVYAPSGGGGGTITDVTVDGTSVVSGGVAAIDLTGKQDTLTSGTNIKNINGNSLLGAGTLYMPEIVPTTQTYYDSLPSSEKHDYYKVYFICSEGTGGGGGGND